MSADRVPARQAVLPHDDRRSRRGHLTEFDRLEAGAAHSVVSTSAHSVVAVSTANGGHLQDDRREARRSGRRQGGDGGLRVGKYRWARRRADRELLVDHRLTRCPSDGTGDASVAARHQRAQLPRRDAPRPRPGHADDADRGAADAAGGPRQCEETTQLLYPAFLVSLRAIRVLGEAAPDESRLLGGTTTAVRVACKAPHRTDVGECAPCGSDFAS